MTRYECFELLAPRITDQLVVTSLSGQKIEWASLSPHEGNLLVGNMGNALAVGLGLALALPKRKVIVLESDGSVLLSLFNLPTLANMNPSNMLVFVFDNEIYSGSRISEPSATAGGTDLEQVARGAGIRNAVTVRDLLSFKRYMMTALDEDELHFVVCKIDQTVEHRKILRTNISPLENKFRFVRYLEKTEGRPIMLGRG
jgi:sulfopyruvate decarboxylase subunit beta